jgi:hypothetical protein
MMPAPTDIRRGGRPSRKDMVADEAPVVVEVPSTTTVNLGRFRKAGPVLTPTDRGGCRRGSLV